MVIRSKRGAAYSNIVVSSSSCETALASGLEVGRVDGLALIMPVDDQRICPHFNMCSVSGP